MSGCWRDFEYEYMSLSEDMEILEYGKTVVPDVRDHVDMPIRYKLERDQYTLFANVDKTSVSPAILFSIEGKSLIDAAIEGSTPSTCIGGFINVLPAEVERRGYPANSIRFLWQPSLSISCRDRSVSEGPDNRLVIAIYNGLGTLIAEEEIAFKILTNGIHREYEGP